jgi:hypothetical protein
MVGDGSRGGEDDGWREGDGLVKGERCS